MLVAFGAVLGLARFGQGTETGGGQRGFSSLEARLNGIENKLEAVRPGNSRQERIDSKDLATLDDLRAASLTLRESILRDVDRRLEVHEQSIESLRQMIEHTDSMLERDLEMLEPGQA